MLEIIIIALACLAGIVTQRVLGFGTSLFLVPALLLYVNAPTAVSVTLILGSIVCLVILYDGRHQRALQLPVLIRLFLASIPGIILGTLIIIWVDKSLLQVVIGTLILISLYIQNSFFPKPTKNLKVAKGINISGFSAGLLGAIAAMAPPPLLLYLRSFIVSPEQIRQMLSAVFLLMNAIFFPALLVLEPESLDERATKIVLLLVPVVVVAMMLGKHASKKLNKKQYNRIINIVLFATAISTIVLGLRSLL